MHIFCPTFGYCVKHAKIQLAFYVLDVSITLFIYLYFMYFLSQCWKKKD